MLKVTRLAVEHQTEPLSLDVKQPCFGWVLDSGGQDVRQAAYALTVDTDGRPVWDTGRVDSGESVSVRYEGAPLASKAIYQVRLTVWDNRGETAQAETSFETGLLEPGDFAARWITHDFPRGETACPVFFKAFSARRPLRARLYASACGIYDAAINGVPVSEDFFAPGWTDYKRRIQYQTYDVTSLIQEENRIELTVAPGWYAGELNGASGHYGGRVAVWAQLYLWYGDGWEELVATGADWQVTTGPVRFAEFYHGETVDETAAPASPMPARRFDAMPLERFTAQQCPPVRIGRKLAPIALLRTLEGEAVLDFGQNLAGIVEITLDARPGQTVTLRHGEVLDGDGNLYTQNLRAARATDTFICKGGPTVLRPRFTCHGFRYVSVEGMGDGPDLDAFRACALHTELERTAELACSDPRVNRLWDNIGWSMDDNFVDVPTDCPQRDERLGWAGDAAIFSRTACQLRDTYLFYRKWLADLAGEQSAELGVPDLIPNLHQPHGGTAVWADSAAIVPWNVYTASGDKDILERQYGSMKGWVEFLRSQEAGRHLRLNGFQRGDWLALDREEGRGNRGSTDPCLIASAFYAHSTWIVARTARELGLTADAEEYETLFEQIRADFQREFITETGRVVGETQTACALILAFDLARPQHVPRIAQTLADNLSRHGGRLTTGFVGTAYLCHALTRAGRHDLAGALLLNGEYPGWLNEVKLGATTIWERWDSLRPDGSMDESGMNSFNHCAFGSIGSWMMEELAGIQPAAPGYREILFSPGLIQGLTWVRASRETPCGTASCAWQCEGGLITVDVTVPVNTSARLVLPEREGGVCLGSGSYHYEYPTDTRLEPLKYTMDSTVAQLRADPAALSLLEQAAPGNAAALELEFLQNRTLRELAALAPPELGQVYADILRQLNEADG